jgi:hypothetical protein
MISLRRLLCRLTLVALSASPVAAAAPSPIGQASSVDDDFDEDTPIDAEHVQIAHAAAALGSALAKALPAMRPFDATHLASVWALSSDALKRASIAKALGWRFTLVGDDVVLEHLVRDSDPIVRAAAEEAAVLRRAQHGAG